jgi:hypothetical protein
MKNQEDNRLEKELAGLRPEDFDGHTEFASMNAEWRLRWLSEIAKFVHDARQSREPGVSSHK